MIQRLTYILILFVLILSINSCNKKAKLQEGAETGNVNFLITQPSITSATFVAKCTNFSVILDTIIFLDPNSSVYSQNMNGNIYEKNEKFTIGGYTSTNGIWIIQFRGKKQENLEIFDVSLPFTMDLDEGGEDEN